MYFRAANVIACSNTGIEPLIAMQRDEHHPAVLNRRTELPPLAADSDCIAKMKHKLKTTNGCDTYRLRKQAVEPVFGIIKHAMKFRQFLLRGAEKNNSDYSLTFGEWYSQGRFGAIPKIDYLEITRVLKKGVEEVEKAGNHT